MSTGYEEMKNFALIGAAGFVAPRHIKAIKDCGGNITLFHDISDSVGMMDSFYRDAEFHRDFGAFRKAVASHQSVYGTALNFFSVCSPNHVHYEHIAAGLELGCDVVCEKPLVPTVRALQELQELEQQTGQKVFTILQLRYHPAVKALKKRVLAYPNSEKLDVELTYVTGRGPWYLESWKGDVERGFGISTNIGIHFFDMLQQVFGELRENTVHLKEPTRAAGFLEFEKARVRWFLSINFSDIPNPSHGNSSTFRQIKVSGEEIDFSNGFMDLHQACYKDFVEGNGYGISDALQSIEITENIRMMEPKRNPDLEHPFLRMLL